MIIWTRAQRGAWLPLTPRGVAAFAPAPWIRLLMVQFVFAGLIAAALTWFLSVAWIPVIRRAIEQLPAQGKIESGRLDWRGNAPQLLAAGNHLAIIVDPDHAGRIQSSAHIQVEFGRRDVRVLSLFGYVAWPYPQRLDVAFNRAALKPWWGAWETPMLWVGIGATLVLLPAAWAVLGAIYGWVAWGVGFFANRHLDFCSSRKLAGAALLPGTLLVDVGFFGYGLNVFDLVQFLALLAVHILVGWIFVLISPFFVAKLSDLRQPDNDPFRPG